MLMPGELPAKAVGSLAVGLILAHHHKRLLLRLMQSAALHIGVLSNQSLSEQCDPHRSIDKQSACCSS